MKGDSLRSDLVFTVSFPIQCAGVQSQKAPLSKYLRTALRSTPGPVGSRVAAWRLEAAGRPPPPHPRSSPVGDGRLVAVLQAGDVLMQVGQAPGRGLGDVAQLVPRHHVGLQVIGERALRTDTHALSALSDHQRAGAPRVPSFAC